MARPMKKHGIYGSARHRCHPPRVFLAGWESLLGLSRPYLGFDLDKSFFHKGGNFYTTSLRVGAYPYHGRFEDATILVSGQLFSKLKYHKRFMIRHETDIDFTYVFNQ